MYYVYLTLNFICNVLASEPLNLKWNYSDFEKTD